MCPVDNIRSIYPYPTISGRELESSRATTVIRNALTPKRKPNDKKVHLLS